MKRRSLLQGLKSTLLVQVLDSTSRDSLISSTQMKAYRSSRRSKCGQTCRHAEARGGCLLLHSPWLCSALRRLARVGAFFHSSASSRMHPIVSGLQYMLLSTAVLEYEEVRANARCHMLQSLMYAAEGKGRHSH